MGMRRVLRKWAATCLAAVAVLTGGSLAAGSVFYENFNSAYISGTQMLGTQFSETTGTTDAAVQVVTRSAGDLAAHSYSWGSGGSGGWGDFSAPLSINDLASSGSLIIAGDFRQSSTSRVDVRLGSMYVLNSWSNPMAANTPGGNYTAAYMRDTAWHSYSLIVNLHTGLATLYVDGFADTNVSNVQSSWTQGSTLATTVGFRIQGSNIGSIDNVRVESTVNTISAIVATLDGAAGNKTVAQGTTVTYAASLVDQDSGQSLSLKLGGAEVAASTGPASPTYSNTVVTTLVGTHAYTYAWSGGDGVATVASTRYINVTNVAPTVTPGSLAGTSRPDQWVDFTVSATDPGGADDPLTYAWDLDNDGSYETIGRTTSLHFATMGLHTVGVKVTDTHSGSVTDTLVVNVIPEPATMSLLTLGAALGLLRRRSKASGR